jgi:transcriptional regulator with XRE-family HTH domain
MAEKQTPQKQTPPPVPKKRRIKKPQGVLLHIPALDAFVTFAGMSQREFARAIGVTPACVTDWYSGRRPRCSPGRAKMIAELLGVHMSAFVTLDAVTGYAQVGADLPDDLFQDESDDAVAVG